MGSTLRPDPAGLSNLMGSSAIWTPFALGASLLAWWDAERSDLITQSGGSVSSWKDSVAGYDAAQTLGASKPIYSATSFNGRPGITGDGVDDYLRLATVPAAIPVGAAACEAWVVVDQTALPADTIDRCVLGWGNLSATSRQVRRAVVSGVNQGRGLVGDGAAQQLVTNTSVNLSGRHIIRLVISGTDARVDVDGVPSSVLSVTPATANNFLTMFTVPAATSNYWQGGLNTALITLPLSVASAAQTTAYLNRRL